VLRVKSICKDQGKLKIDRKKQTNDNMTQDKCLEMPQSFVSIITFYIMTLSIMAFIPMTLSISIKKWDTQHKDIQNDQ
jgi:hypothetical protein